MGGTQRMGSQSSLTDVLHQWGLGAEKRREWPSDVTICSGTGPCQDHLCHYKPTYSCQFPLFRLGFSFFIYGSTGSFLAAAHRIFTGALVIQFPDQGSSPGPLHWKHKSSPLDHQGSPQSLLFHTPLLLFGVLGSSLDLWHAAYIQRSFQVTKIKA